MCVVRMENIEKYLYHMNYFYERRVSSAARIRGSEHVRRIGKGRFIPLAILSFHGDRAFVYNPRDDNDDDDGGLSADRRGGREQKKKCRKTRVADTRNTRERRAR